MTLPLSTGMGPTPGRRRQAGAGFTLVELSLGLGLGSMLFVVLLQGLLLQGNGSERLVRQLRERAVQRRALELMRGEVLRAERLVLQGEAGLPAPCPLAGRRPVLQLQTPQGAVIYTVGAPPSDIWRGQVLMRCGPAYGLDGEISEGQSQNRVLLDSLASSGGFAATRSEALRLQLRLQQRFRLRDGTTQDIHSALEMATAEIDL